MRSLVLGLALGIWCMVAQNSYGGSDLFDPYLWLEDVESPQALTWVKAQNDKSLPVLTSDSRYTSTFDSLKKIMMANDRIPTPMVLGSYIYNVWQDGTHVRGLIRRTSQEDFRNSDPTWETVLDLDELAKKENENWVYQGLHCLEPSFEKCFIFLSRGGKDARVAREFNFKEKKFVENGFTFPEAKLDVNWIDGDHVLLSTDFGDGSLTTSGYPRFVRIVTRGEHFSNAKNVFEVARDDMMAASDTFRDGGVERVIFTRHKSFFESEFFLLNSNLALQKIDVPLDTQGLKVVQGQFIFIAHSDYSKDGILAKSGSIMMRSLKDGSMKKLWEPSEVEFFLGFARAKNHILISTMRDVQVRVYTVDTTKTSWKLDRVELPDFSTIYLSGASAESEQAYLTVESFLQPATMIELDTSTGKQKSIKSQGVKFESADLVVEQKFSQSKDGVRVPYFIVHRKNLVLDSSNPTILYGYGGFDISMLPYYMAGTGKIWLEKGGVFVLANIRGGGEYGPEWHKAALKENRQRAFDDFISIAESLIQEKITQPKKLGIMGGSNGGLLMGAMYTQRPDLFGAVVCQVPLLDMLRFHKLLAGASWMGEYGNPEVPEEREFILKYSPYQNIKKFGTYPKMFILTSTKDDRVHPAHARKMAARLLEYGHPVLYYENIEGGHGGAANIEQKIKQKSLEFTFLFQNLF